MAIGVRFGRRDVDGRMAQLRSGHHVGPQALRVQRTAVALFHLVVAVTDVALPFAAGIEELDVRVDISAATVTAHDILVAEVYQREWVGPSQV